MIVSADAGPHGEARGHRVWPLVFPRPFNDLFADTATVLNGPIASGAAPCVSGAHTLQEMGTTHTHDSLIRYGGCLRVDFWYGDPDAYDLSRLTTYDLDNDNEMGVFPRG